MIKLEINDKKYKIPESFEELTLEQYCHIFFKLDVPNDVEEDEVEQFKRQTNTQSIILSRLLGEDDDFCMGLPINVYGQLLGRTKFLYDINFLLRNSKAGIVIDGKRYTIPPFNEMPLRQYIDADVVMKEKENELQYIELLSILLTAKDKQGKWIKYNGDYQDMMGKLRNMKCSDVLPLVYHFFKKSKFSQTVSQLSMKAVESQQHQHTANS